MCVWVGRWVGGLVGRQHPSQPSKQTNKQNKVGLSGGWAERDNIHTHLRRVEKAEDAAAMHVAGPCRGGMEHAVVVVIGGDGEHAPIQPPHVHAPLSFVIGVPKEVRLDQFWVEVGKASGKWVGWVGLGWVGLGGGGGGEGRGWAVCTCISSLELPRGGGCCLPLLPHGVRCLVGEVPGIFQVQGSKIKRLLDLGVGGWVGR